MATPAYCPLSLQVLQGVDAYPIVGGKVRTYDAGTTTPRTVYRDPALTSAHPNPILTDGYGRIPSIYVGEGAYKVVLADEFGVEIGTADYLPGGAPDPVDPSDATPTMIPTGFISPGYTTSAVDGWVALNGRTLGGVGSGASSRAAADTLDLFVVLWNEDPYLAVSGGRGSNATADFYAGKTIALPDARGLALFGRDSMGATARGLITTASVAEPNQVGAFFGSESVTLTAGQIAAHNHAIAVAAGGAHTPTGTTGFTGNHAHGGLTDQQNLHSHSYQKPTFKVTGATGATERVQDSFLSDNTSDAPQHGHNITTDVQGNHAHGLLVDPVAAHTHTATSDNNAGGGGAHPNMPPGMLVTWYIKL